MIWGYPYFWKHPYHIIYTYFLKHCHISIHNIIQKHLHSFPLPVVRPSYATFIPGWMQCSSKPAGSSTGWACHSRDAKPPGHMSETAPKKNRNGALLSMGNLGWLILGIVKFHGLRNNPGIELGRISSPIYPKQPGFFHCSHTKNIFRKKRAPIRTCEVVLDHLLPL